MLHLTGYMYMLPIEVVGSTSCIACLEVLRGPAVSTLLFVWPDYLLSSWLRVHSISTLNRELR